MSANTSSPDASTRRRCPICAKPSLEQYRPFCSRRCADIDLNRWLSGVYSVPAIEAEGDLDSEADKGESAQRRS